MTNYEKIKSMSFDEMREFFENNFLFYCKICHHRANCSTSSTDKCHKALRDWLKAESEED